VKDLQNQLVASVIICTRNRAAYLGNTIRKAAAQKLSNGNFEIVVVDNGSTDHTSDVVRECQSAITTVKIRYVIETEVGLSVARNRAIRESNGQILCFLDDDAVPQPEWLARLCKVFEQYEKVMCSGGIVIPNYETTPPLWFDEYYEGFFSPKFTNRHSTHITTYPYYPYGANFAVRMIAFSIVGVFDPKLGYRGTNLIPAEETEFLRRLERAGYQIAIDPSAVVRHIIPSERLTEIYFLQRAYAQGRANAILCWRFDAEPMPLSIKWRIYTLMRLFKNFVLLYVRALKQKMSGTSLTIRKKTDWYLQKGYFHQEFIQYLQLWH
jgi:glycosyltransferase involved in cell wall biosynthesis